MIAVLYHAEDGTIIQTMMGQRHNIENTAALLQCSWLEVFEQRDDYDAKFLVVDGKLTPKAED